MRYLHPIIAKEALHCAHPQGQRGHDTYSTHSNRPHINSSVQQKWYQPGSFLNSGMDKASLENEACAPHGKTTEDCDITCVQIAGLVARRILKDIEAGTGFEAGQRYGLSASDQVLISSCRLPAR